MPFTSTLLVASSANCIRKESSSAVTVQLRAIALENSPLLVSDSRPRHTPVASAFLSSTYSSTEGRIASASRLSQLRATRPWSGLRSGLGSGLRLGLGLGLAPLDAPLERHEGALYSS